VISWAEIVGKSCFASRDTRDVTDDKEKKGEEGGKGRGKRKTETKTKRRNATQASQAAIITKRKEGNERNGGSKGFLPPPIARKEQDPSGYCEDADDVV